MNYFSKAFITAAMWRSIAALAVAVVLVMAPPSDAATKNWNDGTGFWNVNGNWNPATVPAIGEPVNIAFSDGAARTVTLDLSTPSLGLLSIDLTGAGAAAITLSIPNNFNLTAAGLFVGGYNGFVLTAGRAAIDQMNGTVTASVSPGVILGYGAGSSGTYTLGSGTLNSNVGSVYVGFNGTGTFNQNAGTVTITNNFLDVGRFTTGNYNLSGGSLTVREEYIADDGTGHFTQTGGTNTVTGATGLIIGYSTTSNGSYAISGGSLNVTGGDLLVCRSGTGTFNVSNGATVTSLSGTLGLNADSAGTATVTGANSKWTTTGALTVGSSGGAVLSIQNQGTVYVGTGLSINSASTVNLSGGTLRFNTISGIARLNYTSGTIQLAGNRDIILDSSIFDLYGASRVITTGKGLTVEGTTTIKQSKSLTVNGGTFNPQGALTIGVSNAAGGSLAITGGGAVTAGADTTIDNFGLATLSGAGSSWTIAGNLALGPTGGRGDVLISNQGNLYISNTLSIGSSGYFTLNGGTIRFNGYSRSMPNALFNYAAGTVQLAGNRTLGSDAATVDFFGASPTIPAGKALIVEGTATLSSSAPLTLSGGAFTADTVLMTPGSRLTNTQTAQVSGSMLALAGSVIDATGANLTLGDATKVNGFYGNNTLQLGQRTVTLADANDAVLDAAALVTLGSGANPGTLNAANGLTLNFGGNITGFGTVDTPDSAATPLINNGHVTGSSAGQPLTLPGYVKGVGTFDNVQFTGTFSPGFSPAKVNLGSATYAGTLQIEIGGLSPGSGYDQLNHILGGGVAQLGGELDVSLINNFTPNAGNRFQIITAAGGISGIFSSFSLPPLAAPLAWSTNQLYSNGLLSVIDSNFLPGDINRDTHVNVADISALETALADLNKYQSAPGPGSGALTNEQLLEIADLAPDNLVNNADLQGLIVYLANNAGALPAPGGGSVTAVPEPSSLVLLAIGLAMASTIRRIRRS